MAVDIRKGRMVRVGTLIASFMDGSEMPRIQIFDREGNEIKAWFWTERVVSVAYDSVIHHLTLVVERDGAVGPPKAHAGYKSALAAPVVTQ